MNEREMLVDFAEKTESLDNSSKLRLLLFLSKAKPNTYIRLKITPKNLEDKQHFEKHNKELMIPYSIRRPKSFEEKERIKGNKIKWKINTKEKIYPNIAITNDILILSIKNGTILAINRENGYIIWKLKVNEEVISKAKITNNYIYLNINGNKIIKLDKKNGEI